MVEFLVVIDRRDAETERDRADEVADVVETEISSMDEFGQGVDVLFHFATIGEAEEAERKLDEADLPFVSASTVHYPEE